MILHNHFLKEAIKLSCFTMGGLLVLFLTMRFASYLGDAASGQVAPEYVTKIVLLKTLVSLKDLIPISLFLGTFAAMTRLQQTSEWISMRAAGISVASMINKLLLVSGIAAIFVSLITFQFSPRAELTLIELKEDGQNNANIAGIKPEIFKRLSGRTKVFYAQATSEDGEYLEKAFVHDDSQQGDAVMSAERAYISTDLVNRKLAVFENGTSYVGKPGTLNYVVTDFSKYNNKIKEKEKSDYTSYPSFVPTSGLMNGNRHYTTELHWRLAPVFTTVLTPILATLIAMRIQGNKWYLSMIIGLSGFFVYQNCLGIGRSLLKNDDIPLALGLWPIHLLFTLCLFCLYTHLQKGYVIRTRKRKRAQ